MINSIRAHLAELITSKFETVQAGSRCLLQLCPRLLGIPASAAEDAVVDAVLVGAGAEAGGAKFQSQ